MQHLIIPNIKHNYSKENLGGKAYHLIEIQKAQLPVPFFFILPTKTIQCILSPIQSFINDNINAISKNPPISIHKIATEIQSKILELSISNDIQTEILKAINTHFDKNTKFAVRSSAAAEDGKNASFAGQHDTFLYVGTDDVFEKIKACIASAWKVGVLTYRIEKGIDIQNIQMAVVIQQMINAEKSGVGFSMHLQGNLADAVIVAGYGLGEGIVADKVETDTYIINRQEKNYQKNIVEKTHQLVFENKQGIVNSSVPTSLQNTSTLSNTQILEVFELTMRAEQLLSCPADIEFSYDENGQLFLLQMRPITTINFEDIKILDNTNIVESYPEITLPLSFSFALKAYEKVFTGSSKAFWVSKKVIEKDKHVFENLLAHYGGRVYYRLDNWYRMMGLVYSSPRSMAAWEKSVGLTNSEKDKVKFSFQNQLKTILSVIWLVINYKRGNRRFFSIFKKNYAFLRNIEVVKENPKTLWQHYEKATEQLFKPWYLTLVNDFLAFKFFGWLQDFIKRQGIGEEALANDLLCGIGGVESEEAVLNVLRLKAEILNLPALKALFQQEAIDILKTFEQGKFPHFYKNFQFHAETYGDRTLAELKLEAPSLRKNPILLVRLLKNQLNSPVNINDFRAQQRRIKTQAEQLIQSKLKWYQPKTYLFRFLRNLATYGLKNRENMRFCRTRGYGAVKDIFLAFGELMVRNGDLNNIHDIFYLNVNDVKDWALNQNPNRQDLQEKTDGLKDIYDNYENIELPNRVIYESAPPSFHAYQGNQTLEHADNLFGIPVSKGKVTAEVAVILSPTLDTNVQSKILVSKMTDPGWVFLMTQAVGLVSEKGSLLSHTAIVGRELGIPVIVNVPNVTAILKDGDVIKMDGDLGTIQRIS